MSTGTDNLERFRAEPIAFLRGIARQGDFAHFAMAGRNFVLANRPALIREVLVTQQAAFKKGPGLLRTEPLLGKGLLTASNAVHRRHRRIVQPAFHSNAVAEHAPGMLEAITQWLEARALGEEFDLHREMTRLTLTIAGRSLFDTDLSSESDSVYDGVAGALATLYGALADNRSTRLPRGGATLPEADAFADLALRARKDRQVDCKCACPAQGSAPGSLLISLLLQAEKDGGLSEREVADEAVTFLLAAHESVANALVWTFVQLARNPQSESRLHEELERVLAGHSLTPSDWQELAYTQAVVSESLRCCPPAWMMSRVVVRDVRLGDEDVPAGTIVVLAPCVTHRDPRYWGDPEAFRPERWLEPDTARPRFAYFPFGAGARACIGEDFALQELTLAVAAIASRWRVTLDPDAIIEPQPLVTLRPKFGCPVRLTAWNDNVNGQEFV